MVEGNRIVLKVLKTALAPQQEDYKASGRVRMLRKVGREWRRANLKDCRDGPIDSGLKEVSKDNKTCSKQGQWEHSDQSGMLWAKQHRKCQ